MAMPPSKMVECAYQLYNMWREDFFGGLRVGFGRSSAL